MDEEWNLYDFLHTKTIFTYFKCHIEILGIALSQFINKKCYWNLNITEK